MGVDSQGEVKALHGLARRTLAEVVEGAEDHDLIALLGDGQVAQGCAPDPSELGGLRPHADVGVVRVRVDDERGGV